MQDFRKLLVWQKGQRLAASIYRATATFPDAERFGLTSQMRRAAISIPADIAEGCGRASWTEFRQFLHIAIGSANELISFILLCSDLGLLTPKQVEVLERASTDTKQMLTRLSQRVATTRTEDTLPTLSFSDGER